jgi:spoIIIJ-associated protein
MTTFEFTGKSVKEAIAKACDELKSDEALLDIEVLEESTRGFLGIVGQRDARIRVKKRDILKEVLEAEPVAKQESDASEEKFEADHQPVTMNDELDKEEGSQEFTETRPVKIIDPKQIAQAKEVLEEILRRMPVEISVEASSSDGAIHLDIKGDGSGLLIGKKGQTLDSLQYLVNKIINKENAPGEKTEVTVDTENYRLRKKENLREMALKVSQKAKKTLRPVSLNPMPPHERRIVHLILAEDREVYTKSYGEGPLRRIIVYPRRGAAGKRKRR